MENLTDLPNLGPDTARQLQAVGITTAQALRQTGSREAWLRIQAQDSSACYNRLLGLEGAVRGIRKAELPESVKAELKEFYQAHKLG